MISASSAKKSFCFAEGRLDFGGIVAAALRQFRSAAALAADGGAVDQLPA
jgi:hypothetical protein